MSLDYVKKDDLFLSSETHEPSLWSLHFSIKMELNKWGMLIAVDVLPVFL